MLTSSYKSIVKKICKKELFILSLLNVFRKAVAYSRYPFLL